MSQHQLCSQWNSTFFITFSLIIEGTTEKVLQFIMPLKSICNQNLKKVLKKKCIFEHYREVWTFLWPFHSCPLYAYVSVTQICIFSGLYYKQMTIINYASSIVNKLKALNTDDARVIIYNHHVFIVQATGVLIYHTLKFTCFWPIRPKKKIFQTLKTVKYLKKYFKTFVLNLHQK